MYISSALNLNSGLLSQKKYDNWVAFCFEPDDSTSSPRQSLVPQMLVGHTTSFQVIHRQAVKMKLSL